MKLPAALRATLVAIAHDLGVDAKVHATGWDVTGRASSVRRFEELAREACKRGGYHVDVHTESEVTKTECPGGVCKVPKEPKAANTVAVQRALLEALLAAGEGLVAAHGMPTAPRAVRAHNAWVKARDGARKAMEEDAPIAVRKHKVGG